MTPGSFGYSIPSIMVGPPGSAAIRQRLAHAVGGRTMPVSLRNSRPSPPLVSAASCRRRLAVRSITSISAQTSPMFGTRNASSMAHSAVTAKSRPGGIRTAIRSTGSRPNPTRPGAYRLSQGPVRGAIQTTGRARSFWARPTTAAVKPVIAPLSAPWLFEMPFLVIGFDVGGSPSRISWIAPAVRPPQGRCSSIADKPKGKLSLVRGLPFLLRSSAEIRLRSRWRS